MAATAEDIKIFASRFKALTGNSPFPWQCAFYAGLCSGDFPTDVTLPTGAGKTSIMAVWLLALAEALAVHPLQNRLPRRLVWVVNRRVVVDQATDEAEGLRKKLRDPSIRELDQVREELRKLLVDDSDEFLGISTLRGQFEDNAEWRGDPAKPAIIVGTVDMIGSRLLFSGYGIGFKARPLHAGFLGQDVLLVHDEAHLEHPFQELLNAICKEQKRCRELGHFRVMALTATSRAGSKECGDERFELTDDEKDVPDSIPSSNEPLHVIWRRQAARKKIICKEKVDPAKLANEIATCALQYKDQGQAVLIFANFVEDVFKIIEELEKKVPKKQICSLTGTLRGLEREDLIKEEAFQRFLPSTQPSDSKTVYLVCTSAGEVGINISADHLVCDLSTFESMVQRFGRVNRFGNRTDTEVHIFAAEEKKDSDLAERRRKTLGLLKELNGDGSPKSIASLCRSEPETCSNAFAPTPEILPATDILFDAWALTSIKGKLPGRPPVEPYLHGITNDAPETYIAWRKEVEVITGDLREQYKPQELLEDYSLKPHELLRDRSDRVRKELVKLAEQHGKKPVWLLADDDTVKTYASLEEALKDKDRINNVTVLLPPSAGGLRNGFLNGSSPAEANLKYDVSDEWLTASGERRRVRIWQADTESDDAEGDNADVSSEIEKMRLIRTIDTHGEDEENGADNEGSSSRYWSWYELPQSADNDGSKRSTGPVLLDDHRDDVVREMRGIVARLPLPDGIRKVLIVAACFHDLGKKRIIFQISIGNTKNVLLGKSGKRKQAYSIGEKFRHEFGSLLEVEAEQEFQALSRDEKDLVLHLIAAHHGYARPHFPQERAFDQGSTPEKDARIAIEAAQRFGRLQRKYGRWGLAYLESLLRAADWAASANPTKFWKEGE